jgi:hypothetical protein
MNTINGVCTIDENNYEILGCLEPFACDGCPYNLISVLLERLEVGL